MSKAKAPPKKNAIAWVRIELKTEQGESVIPEEYEEVELGLKYLGPKKVRQWGLEMRKAQDAEKARQLEKGRDLQAQFDRLQAALRQITLGEGGIDDLVGIAQKALSETDIRGSTDFEKDWDKIMDKVLRESVAGVRGLVDEDDQKLPEGKQEVALEFIEWMGPAYEHAVFQLAQEVQQLSMRQRFRPSGAGE